MGRLEFRDIGLTDIADSTVLAQSMGDIAWAGMVGSHETRIRHITRSQGGTVVIFLGDGSMLAFESARAAIRAAVEIQRACADEPYTIRIGIHSGEVIRTADDLFGLTVNKAARVAAAAPDGGIVISSTTRDRSAKWKVCGSVSRRSSCSRAYRTPTRYQRSSGTDPIWA